MHHLQKRKHNDRHSNVVWCLRNGVVIYFNGLHLFAPIKVLLDCSHLNPPDYSSASTIQEVAVTNEGLQLADSRGLTHAWFDDIISKMEFFTQVFLLRVVRPSVDYLLLLVLCFGNRHLIMENILPFSRIFGFLFRKQTPYYHGQYFAIFANFWRSVSETDTLSWTIFCRCRFFYIAIVYTTYRKQ